MELIYEITFNSQSQYIKHIIEQNIKQSSIKAKCQQSKESIYIVCNDTEEKIETFFKQLEQKLPLSIFMKSSQLVESLPSEDKLLADNEITPVLSLSNEEVAALIANNDGSQKKSAQMLENEEIITLETSNGLFSFAKATAENRVALEKISSNVNMFIANTSAFERLFSLNQNDVQLLCSIERPLVKLKLNFQANTQKQYSATDYIYAKMPYDKATFLLAYEIKALGLDALIYCSKNKKNEEIKVGYIEQNTFIIEGNNGLFPKYDVTAQKTFQTSKEYFDFYGGVYEATLHAFDKTKAKTIGVYFTTQNNDSEIAVYSELTQKRSIIHIPNIHLDLATNLEEIANIDENTARLIENYKKRSPQLFENEELVFSDSSGFESIINLIAYLLGIENSKAFEALAHNFVSKSGINIDMKVVKISGENYLDYRRVVQSIMSYKMADVPNDLLAFSFYESLSEFISNQAATLKSELACDEIVLCGNMFANTTLLEKTYKALNKTFNVIIPKEYPLDYN